MTLFFLFPCYSGLSQVFSPYSTGQSPHLDKKISPQPYYVRHFLLVIVSIILHWPVNVLVFLSGSFVMPVFEWV